MNHLIVRQIFDVRLRSEQPAYGVQQSLSHFFRESVAPALEQLFDRMAPDGTVLRLDRLEIDLGALNLQQLTDEETLRRIIRAIEEQLRSVSEGSAGSAALVDAKSSRFEQWLYFLMHGSLPWHASVSDAAALLQPVIETLALDAAAVEQLRSLLRRSESALDRLVLQHDAATLRTILTLSGGRSMEMLPVFIKEIVEVHKQTGDFGVAGKPSAMPPRKLVAWFWKWAFHAVMTGRENQTGEVLLRQFLLAVPDTESLARLKQATEGKTRRRRFPVLARILESVDSTDKGPVFAQKQAKKPTDIPEKAEGDATPGAAGKRQAPARPGSETAQPAQAAGDRKPAAQRPPDALRPPLDIKPPFDAAPAAQTGPVHEWHLDNTGVVMLNNYLTAFFKNAGLTGGASFKSPEHSHKAALLLHFLATGRDGAAEFELVLPKLLCGIPLGMPLDCEITLTDDEKEEADGLLQAVIDHWTALGNASPDAVREAFLMRPGKLGMKNNGWRLYVERRTIDILFDRAPFSIGVVKLPWMKDILWVEW